MSEWQPIETAPVAECVWVQAGGMTFKAAWFPSFSLDENGEECDQWLAEEEDEHPPCWTDGACWETNADMVQSAQPTHWMPLAKDMT